MRAGRCAARAASSSWVRPARGGGWPAGPATNWPIAAGRASDAWDLGHEVAEIVAVFHEWGEVDRSHRKLAHRGSYLPTPTRTLVMTTPHPRIVENTRL